VAERVLMLIDGHSLVFRGFYALQELGRPFTNAKGELTTGVYAFTSMLLKALEDLKPQYAGAAFDMSKPTVRLNEFAAYKGTRTAAPPGLHDEAKVTDKYGGLRPSQVPDFKALRGDTTDNIPGVAGIGDKGAQKLLLEFGSVEAVYEGLEQVPEK